MKKPFLYALDAALYIVVIVLAINLVASSFPGLQQTIIIPMIMLSLFVFSAAVMGFLFLSEPLRLFLENQKQEAFIFFGKTLAFFACFVVIFIILLIFH